jgi:anti-anti-sigma factor
MEAGAACVRLSGEHDASTVPLIRRALDAALALDADVVVDLARVGFLGAAPIGELLGARAALLERSRTLTMRAPSRSARRIFELCGLSGLIEGAGRTQRLAPGERPAPPAGRRGA